jgi:hypothetical protein
MKHLCLDINQVAFCAGQKAENDFVGQVDTLNLRFIELALVAFCDG